MTYLAQRIDTDDVTQGFTGIHTFTADFVTPYRVIRAEVISPEFRLTDCLNSFSQHLEIRPCQAQDRLTNAATDLTGTIAHIFTASLLFVLPVNEPERRAGPANTFWKSTVRHRCSAALGQYWLSGAIHFESSSEPRLALRLLNRQFIPLTDVTLTDPEGKRVHHPVVIVNREALDLLAV